MISETVVGAVSDFVRNDRGEGHFEQRFRSSFPELRATFCSEDDIVTGKPVAEGGAWQLFLFGGDHCMTLTNDPAIAVGVVLAERED